MTRLTKALALAALATSLISFAAPSHAQNNSFNKFPVSATSNTVKGLQSATYMPADVTAPNLSSTTRRSIKRVVKPLPQTRTLGLSYVADTGTEILERGFNKMRPNKLSPARPMKIIVDERAYSAR